MVVVLFDAVPFNHGQRILSTIVVGDGETIAGGKQVKTTRRIKLTGWESVTFTQSNG